MELRGLTTPSAALTQFAVQPQLCTRDLQTQLSSCSAPKLSAGAASRCSPLAHPLPSYTAKSRRTQAELHPPPRNTPTQDPK